MDVDGFLKRFAHLDVQRTIQWLSTNGYTLGSHSGGSTLGAQFVYVGAAEVRITVDRSQWFLDVAAQPGKEPWQYDLLIAGQSGRPYGEVFPGAGSRPMGESLPDQLPEGVSWLETLPKALRRLNDDGLSDSVDRARRERSQVMRPRGGGR